MSVTDINNRVPRIVDEYFAACDRADALLPASPEVLAAVFVIDGRRVQFGDLTHADLRRLLELDEAQP